jgi:hypothetical protein
MPQAGTYIKQRVLELSSTLHRCEITSARCLYLAAAGHHCATPLVPASRLSWCKHKMSEDYKAAFRAAQAQRGLAAKPVSICLVP